LVARILHKDGPRARGPFIDVNCAAIPETLLEAELFGFERGAFTDARRAKPGLFQAAHQGTIFLDEVGLLPDLLQAKLLTVLEERRVRRLGATESERIDVWVLSATNADLRVAVRERRFREDLYHRLAVLPITVPPLRERGRDILLLAEWFLARACQEYGLPARRLTADAETRLRAYRWPGNVRELGNVIERVALLAEGETVTASMLGLEVSSRADPVEAKGDARPTSPGELMRRHLLAALEQTGWNISQTATLLGISRNTVRARIERFRLRAGEPGGPVPDPPGKPAPVIPEASAMAGPSKIRWERRPVTFVRVAVAPLEGDDLPDTSRTLELIVSKLQTFGGKIEEIGQSGLDATFGAEPLEDAPRRAANAALALVRGAESGEEVTTPVRVAIHANSVLVGRISGTAEIDRADKRTVSDELDNALRAAEPGVIVLTQATGPLLDRRFKVANLTRVAGAGPGPLRLAGRGGSELGFGGRLGPFVGRSHEMDLLETRWTTAAEGSGQIVGIVGDPGVGKSRLLWEFLRGRREQTPVFEAKAEALVTPTPYGPIVELLRLLLAIERGDDAQAVRDRLTRHVHELDPVFAPIVPPLLALLDVTPDEHEWRMLDAPQRRQRMHDAVKALFLRESRRRPIVLAIEDVHWLDSESQTLLEGLADGLPAAPVLLLVTYRPEYRHRWGGSGFYTQLRVDPLRVASAHEFVRSLVGEHTLLGEMPTRLVEWTGGNPLFLEETVRSLAETGTLVGERGAYRLAGPMTSLQIPRSVEEVLAERIDRLGEDERILLQSSAVIGRDVPYLVLSAVAGTAGRSLREELGHLRDAEFLYEASTFPESEYTFKHALTHAVAYRSLPDTERRALHAKVLEAIEVIHRDRLAEHVDRLAHHAFFGEIWDKALPYSRQAGAKAVARSANTEAAACFARALTALEHLPVDRERSEQAVDLHLLRANSLVPIADFGPIVGHLEEAAQLAESLEDLPRLGRVLSFMSAYAWMVGDHQRSVEYGQRALDIAGSVNDLTLRVRTNLGLGQAYHGLGDYRRAVEALERNVDELQGDLLGRRFGLVGVASVLSRAWLVWSLAELGEFARVLPRGEEAVRIAEAINHPYSRLTAYFGMGCLHLCRGDPGQAIAVLEPALELCRTWDTQLRLWFMGVAPALGHAYALVGRTKDALPLLEKAVAQAAANGSMYGQSLRTIWLAHAQLIDGDRAEARRLALEALALARRYHERGYEVWIHGILGDIAAQGNPPDPAAEAAYRGQIALSRELGMRPRMAIGHLGLGRLYRRIGDADRAREHLDIAADLFRAMEMSTWLTAAESERSGLDSR
jgi:tetratricopeptide (TPR) repeat protein